MDCGACTACCTVLPIAVIGKPINTPCQYCDKGCSIYEGRPKTCAEFECAYYQGKELSEKLRPDNCGIIFFKRTDRIFTGAVVEGVKATAAAKHQIGAFNKQGFTVILLSEKEKTPLLCLAEGHEADDIMREYTETLDGYL